MQATDDKRGETKTADYSTHPPYQFTHVNALVHLFNKLTSVSKVLVFVMLCCVRASVHVAMGRRIDPS